MTPKEIVIITKPKCRACSTLGRQLFFAFREGMVIYCCSKCYRRKIRKDMTTLWFPLPKLTWEKPDVTKRETPRT